MIVEHKPTVRMPWPSRLILLALAACVLPLSLMAQSQPEQKSGSAAPLAFDLRIPALGNDLSSVDSRLFSFYVGVDDPDRAGGRGVAGATQVADSEEGSANGVDPRIMIMLSSADEVLSDLEWIVTDLADEERSWKNTLHPSLDIFLLGVDRQQPIHFDLLVGANERSGAIESRWQPSFPIAEQGAQLPQFISNNLQAIGIRVDRRDEDYYELLGTYIGWMRLVDGYACLAGYEADIAQQMTSPRAAHDELARAGFSLAVQVNNAAESRGERLAMFEDAERKLRFNRRPDESRARSRVRATLERQNLALLRRLFVDTGRVTIGWTLDREREQGQLDFYADAISHTLLADDIARIGTQPSAFSALTIPQDPIAGVRINLPVSTDDGKLLRLLASLIKPAAHEVLDDRQQIADASKAAAKTFADKFFDLLISAVDTERLDLMFDLEQAADGQPQLLAGLGVTNGRQADDLLRLVPEMLPGASIEMNIDSVASTDIHSLKLTNHWPQVLSDTFGKADSIYVGTSDSRIWICSGSDSLGRLKLSITEVASADLSLTSAAQLCQFRVRSHPLLELCHSLTTEFGRDSAATASAETQPRSRWRALDSATWREIAIGATTDVDDRISGQFQRVDNHIDGRILISHGLLRAAGETFAALGELNVGSKKPLATSKKPTQQEAAAKADGTPHPSTITVQRKSYAIDGAIGQAVVRLLEQMQRSGLVDPLLAHLNGGNGAAWDGEQWNYQTSVTVITSPPAHEAIGTFIDGLRALRPAPGQSGPEELQIRKVVYEREASWDTSRELAGLLGEAVKMGHIGYVRITSDTSDRMVISTTDPVHKVLRPFIDFLNEQQSLRVANELAGMKDPLAGGTPLSPLYGSGRSALQGFPTAAPQQVGGPGASSTLSSETTSTPPAASAKRPQVVTDAEELEEVTVVSREYKLDMQAVQQVREFLLEVRDGFRVLRLSDPLSPAPDPGSPYPGSGYDAYGSDGFGYAIPPIAAMSADGTHPGIPLRILAPAEAHAVLEGFLELFAPAKGEPPAEGEQTIVLVRTEYELPPTAAEKFAALLTSSEQHGVTSPLIVNHKESRVTVTAAKDVQERIRRLITYLGENWQTAGLPQEDVRQPLKRLAGIELAPLSEQERKQVQSKFPGGGVKIVGIDETAPLRARGIRVGDVLIALDGMAVSSVGDIQRKLDLIRRGEVRHFVVDRSGEEVSGEFVPNDRRITEPIPGMQPSTVVPQIPKAASRPASSEKVQELDLKIAELELEWANETLKATKRFVEKGFKTESDLKAAELEVLKARRELERLKSRSAGQQQPSDKEAPATDPQATDDSADRGAARQDDASLRENVSRAVQRAQQYLVSQQSSGGSWSTERSGAHALVLLALAKSGAEDEDTLRTGLEYLRSVEGPEETYDIALMIMAFAAIDNGRDDHGRIAVLAKRLEESQNRTEHPGSWGYGRGRSGWYDNSNSLFALLGLHAAAGTGYQIDPATLRRARDHWLRVQVGDREAAEGAGWSYTDAKFSVTGSMTLAGICSLTIIQSLLPEGPADGNAEQDEVQQAIDAGARWLGENFQVRKNPGDANWALYYLYCLERAGRLSGRQTFGNHDWYREGAQFLVEAQSSRDGTWRSGSPYEQDPIFGTAFGLLFLAVAEKAG